MVAFLTSLRPLTLSLAIASLALATGGCAAKPDPDRQHSQLKPSKEVHPMKKSSQPPAPASGANVHTTRVTTMDGADKSLGDYAGKALLIVNTASRCGYTPQYADLQTIHADYGERGFEVLAFPSNDFGGQEPGTHEEIKRFCDSRYAITFPLFAKTRVKGPDKASLYKLLTEETSASIKGDVRWNFTKFLVGPGGDVLARFEPGDVPTGSKVRSAIEAALPR